MTALGRNPARHALRDVTRPVVLVPQGERDGLPEPLTVVAAVPRDGSVDRAVSVAAELVGDLNARLVLAYSWSGPEDDAAVERLRRSLPADLAVEVRPRNAEAAIAVEEVAADVEAGLIVLGAPAHGPLLSALLGSTTHEVASQTRVPIVVVPGESG